MSDNTQTNPLNVDFSHRLNVSDSDHTFEDLAENLSLMTYRALGVLQLTYNQLERDGQVHVCAALNAVQQEIRDIQALADAYAKAEVNHD